MTNPTSAQQTALINYILAEDAIGNHVLKDEEYILALGAINSLIGVRGKTATVNGTPTFNNTGTVFTGSQHINTNYNPTVDEVNVSQNDILYMLFNHTYTGGGSFLRLFGASSPGGGIGDTIMQNIFGNLQAGVNGDPQTVNGLNYANDTLYGVGRSNGIQRKLYLDGITNDISNSTSNGLLNTNVIIGGHSTQGVPSNSYQGTVSHFMVSRDSGFDYAGHNTNIRTLLTALAA